MKLTTLLFALWLFCYVAADMPPRKNERSDGRPIGEFRGNDRKEGQRGERNTENRRDGKFIRQKENKMMKVENHEFPNGNREAPALAPALTI
jgi:hypothetical protein